MDATKETSAPPPHTSLSHKGKKRGNPNLNKKKRGKGLALKRKQRRVNEEGHADNSPRRSSTPNPRTPNPPDDRHPRQASVEATQRIQNMSATVEEIDELLMEEERSMKKMPLLDRITSFRISVAFIFQSVFKCEKEDEIEKKIRERLGLHPNTKVMNVLDDILACKEAGIQYTGESDRLANCGRKAIIDLESIAAQIVADVVEKGGGILSSYACEQLDLNSEEVEETEQYTDVDFDDVNENVSKT